MLNHDELEFLMNIFYSKETIKESYKTAIIFTRKGVGDEPVMLEKNWFSALPLPHFTSHHFSDGSFFKTLSQKYLIEITGSDQELRAESANGKTAEMLKIEVGAPLLHISIKFYTSITNLHIYSELYCNTTKFPVGNSYHL